MFLSNRSSTRSTQSTRWVAIIGLLLTSLLLSACSMVRLGYNNAPSLAYWWLDSYVDFDSRQATRIRSDLQSIHAWHRREELPLLAQALKRLQSMAHATVTPEQICSVVEDVQARSHSTFERFLPTVAAIAPTLQPAQLQHMAHEFEKRNHSWREDWLDGTVTERNERRIRQIVDRAESFYGTLQPQQLALIHNYVTNSGFDAQRQFRETQRRQQDTLQVLQDIRATKPGSSQAMFEIRALLERSLRPPDPNYRRYRDQLTSQGCHAMAQLHNSATPGQRDKFLHALQGYESDVLALASQSLPARFPE